MCDGPLANGRTGGLCPLGMPEEEDDAVDLARGCQLTLFDLSPSREAGRSADLGGERERDRSMMSAAAILSSLMSGIAGGGVGTCGKVLAPGNGE